jgi:hypothetical protein
MNEPESGSQGLNPSEKEAIFARPGSIQLTTVAEQVGIKAQFDPARAINSQRWVMIAVICLLFFLLNGVVCYLINKTIDLEFGLLSSSRPIADNQRIITNGVFMSLIGATVVQTGLVIRGISNFLFKEDKPI